MSLERRLRILLVDDDPNAIDYLAFLLRREFPGADVTSRLTADVTGAFDVYLIDNDFSGQKIAGRLTEEIRLRAPDALVLAFSASLDSSTLKELVNAGCDAVADKAEPADQALLMDLIRRYAAKISSVDHRRQPRLSTVQSVLGLLREWNRRYEASREQGGAA